MKYIQNDVQYSITRKEQGILKIQRKYNNLRVYRIFLILYFCSFLQSTILFHHINHQCDFLKLPFPQFSPFELLRQCRDYSKLIFIFNSNHFTI